MVELFENIPKTDESAQAEKAAREAMRARTNENIDQKDILTSQKNNLVSAQGQNFNYSEALKTYNDFNNISAQLYKEGKISKKDYEILDKLAKEAVVLLEKQKKGTLTERERDKLLLLESQYNKEMNRTLEENKHKLNKREIDWFNEQIKKSNERIKDLTADVMNLGVRNDFVDFHAQRLMQAMINQVNIANQQRELTMEQKMVEYMDKLAFVRESVKQVAEAKETKNEKKIEEAVKYVETYDHETKDLTETMRAAQVFVLATRSQNHEEKIEKYRENTTLEFGDGTKEKPLTDYVKNTVPFRI